MKTYLKYISAILFCYIMMATEKVNAQRFALCGGIENTSIAFKNKPDNISGKAGFAFGWLMEGSLNEKDTWVLNIGCDYTLRGYKEEYSTLQYILYNRMYMGLSLALSYRFSIVEDVFSLLPYVGPYGECLMIVSDSEDTDYKREYIDKYMNSLDWGIKIGVSVEIFRNIQFAVERNTGLSSIYKESDTKVTNTGTRFCVRLFF